VLGPGAEILQEVQAVQGSGEGIKHFFIFQTVAMLKNVVGLVTGGASGLGKATVER
jgi:hypothetical protein